MTRQAFNCICAEVGTRAGLSMKVHPHMLRHSCGFALANKGRDTRLIQEYLGHRNIRHTQVYTRTRRFDSRDCRVSEQPRSAFPRNNSFILHSLHFSFPLYEKP